MLRGKDSYHFVDVIDVIGFDINKPEGTDVLKTINKRSADFADPIKAGDVIELKWI